METMCLQDRTIEPDIISLMFLHRVFKCRTLWQSRWRRTPPVLSTWASQSISLRYCGESPTCGVPAPWFIHSGSPSWTGNCKSVRVTRVIGPVMIYSCCLWAAPLKTFWNMKLWITWGAERLQPQLCLTLQKTELKRIVWLLTGKIEVISLPWRTGVSSLSII